MNIRSIYLASCAAGLLIAATISFGGNSISSIESTHAKAVVTAVFNRLDCDLDGTIDPSEVDDHIAQLWHPIDRDQSRSLSKKEYSLTHRSVSDPIGAALFRDADINTDDQVSVSEFRKHLKRMILMFDSDGDFEVSLSDVGLKPMPTLKNNPFVSTKTRAEGS